MMRAVLHVAGAQPRRQLLRIGGIDRPKNGIQQTALHPALIHKLVDFLRAQHALLAALLMRAGNIADLFQLRLQIRHQRGRHGVIHKHLHPRGLGCRRCRIVILRRRQLGQIRVGRAQHLARIQMRAARKRVIKTRCRGRIPPWRWWPCCPASGPAPESARFAPTPRWVFAWPRRRPVACRCCPTP